MCCRLSHSQVKASSAVVTTPIVRVRWNPSKKHSLSKGHSEQVDDPLVAEIVPQLTQGQAASQQINQQMPFVVSGPSTKSSVGPLQSRVGVVDADERVVAESRQRLNTGAPTGRYYSRAVGKIPGVYNSWALAYAQTNKHSGSSCKGFSDLEHALEFIREHQMQVGIQEDILQYDTVSNQVARWRYRSHQPNVGSWQLV
jgi:hypothetical protein